MRASRPGQSALLLLDVVELLRRENIDYLVIGAFALAVHGVVRASRDADALLQISPADGPQDLLDAKDAYLSADGPVDLDLMRRITRRFGRDAADRLERILSS